MAKVMRVECKIMPKYFPKKECFNSVGGKFIEGYDASKAIQDNFPVFGYSLV